MSKFLFFFSACLILSSGTCLSQIKLPDLIHDNMVLQQKSKVALWGDADPNSEIEITTSWNNKHYKTKADGTGKWKVMVGTAGAGGPYEISFSSNQKPITVSNVLLGEVWLCSGQSNMEMTFKGFGPTTQPILNQPGSEANNPNLRLFTVEKATAPRVQELAKGKWLECTTESAANFSAVAYQFGKMLSDSLKVPVGLIVSSWGGSRVEQWMSKENLQSFPEVKIPEGIDTIKVLDRVPTVLFNAMLVPLVNYGIRGFLWYQGESNRDKPILYANLVPAMVKEWRKVWGKKDLPFYYVQIAPHAYAKDPNKYYGVLIREAQLKSENKIPNSGMVVILDVGSELKIHPPDKTTVSKRLSDIALAKTYGRKGISYFSPTYHSMKIAGDKIVLNFDHAHNGLKSSGTELENFEIAGDDQVFHPAKATILPGGKVEVWSPETPKPVAVRYGFKNWVHGDLFNSEGLPASSFRTDSWDIAPFSFK